MSQRPSGYERKERDQYQTPAWVTNVLVPHIPNLASRRIWEPACGTGQMVRELQRHCADVHASDIEGGIDFLQRANDRGADAIITNPPYTSARAFIEHALALTKPHAGMVAMLLRTDYDHAVTRHHLFACCPAFAKKLVLTKRIVWFDRPGKSKSPSYNHAWFVWNWAHEGPPVLAYAVKATEMAPGESNAEDPGGNILASLKAPCSASLPTPGAC
jgi:hypothetical protein